MSTITPTSDSATLPNQTSFKIGDLVRRTSDRVEGRVIEINFTGRPTLIFVRWNQGSPGSIDVFSVSRA